MQRIKDENFLVIEAALYASGRPMSISELADIVKTDIESVRKILRKLIKDYTSRNTALEIVELPNERFVLQLKPELTPKIASLIPGGLLSYATLKTLVFIALKQPIKQSELVQMRGAHVYEHVRELEEKKFIQVIPEGRTKVLTTTDLFADYFGFDYDKIRMKAQLRWRLRKILKEKDATQTEKETSTNTGN